MELLDNIQKAITHKVLTSRVKGVLKDAVHRTGEHAHKEMGKAASEAEHDGSQQALEKLETESVKILLDFTRGQVKIATAAFLVEIQGYTVLANLGLLPEEETKQKTNTTLQALDSFINHEIESLRSLEPTVILPSNEWLAKNLYITASKDADGFIKNPLMIEALPPEMRELLIPAAERAAEIIKSHAQDKIASIGKPTNS